MTIFIEVLLLVFIIAVSFSAGRHWERYDRVYRDMFEDSLK